MDFEAIFGSALRSALGPQAAAYALLAIGLNVHYGYTGLLNFGQVGFMMVGAYGVGISVATWGLPLWAGVLIGLLAAVVLAIILGAPTLRLRADYFAITTIAVAEVLRLLFRSGPARPITGGPFGLQAIAGDFYAVNPLSRGIRLGPISYTPQVSWALLVTWGLVALITIMIALLMRSPWGRILRAIREDEDAARALGKNVFSYKMQSLILGGVIGSVGGIMFAITGSTVNADSFRPQITFFAYAILILGGAATRVGPIVGAVIFWFLFSGVQVMIRQMQGADLLPGVLGTTTPGGPALILMGTALVLLVVYRPQGIFGDPRELKLDA
ncbi:branched-chain amino acid ABC transporter permease [Nitriliruptor alkaliphilus]|uniref:branched-chain amino acid ABC transporter permease n=1 Tax=Nitriliruptor alkaliphilus TaxID=427918 RepID=UPI00069907B2|nr:branched-chain amino acid ABC transporter permease [Nitriliruptor alkaliphilus]